MSASGTPSAARTFAFPAPPATIWPDKDIISAVWMPLEAMSALCMRVIAIANAVETVLTTRTPHQVIQTVVGRIVVKVATLQAFRARTNEGFENKAMDVTPTARGIKDDSEIAMGIRNWREDALIHRHQSGSAGHSAGNGTNGAGVADLVILKAHNRFPHVTHSTVRNDG